MEENILKEIKANYSKTLRKEVVRSILQHETNNDKEAIKSSYNTIDQIFSYVIGQLNWKMAEHTAKWDDAPLKIITEAFPKINKTKWFKEKQLQIKK